jgi:hypothetical protein
MSDVRGRLVAVISLNEYGNLDHIAVADAILDHFDVTPKPTAISDVALGSLVQEASGESVATCAKGASLHKQLRAAGFKIVRVEE